MDLGFSQVGEMPAMIRAVTVELPAAHPDLQVIEVEDEKALRVFGRTLLAGFESIGIGLDDPGAVLRPSQLGDERMQFWLGLAVGQPVTTAWSALSEGLVAAVGPR